MPPIFRYMNYRQYLSDCYGERKKTTPVFSYRYFSKHAGLRSPNFLKLVMDGKRNLSPDGIHRFARALQLTGRERRFFELLVCYNQSSDPTMRQHYYQQLLDFAEYRQVHHLEREQYAYLAHWYYPAVLELVSLPDFREDAEWIAVMLQRRISIREAKEAIGLLLTLGLLQRADDGRLRPAHTALTTGEEARSLAAFSFHEQVLAYAKEAVRAQAPEAREFAAITMAINARQLQHLKEMLREFRKRVLAYLSQEHGAPTAVYQFSAQVFAFTQSDVKQQGEERKG